MKRHPAHKPKLAITDADEEDTTEPEIDPLSALVLHQDHHQQGDLDVAKLPSVKPADSLILVPRQLESSQHLLFLTVDKPSSITLKSVVDKAGDRFHITPHKEAIVVECPTGGYFTDDSGASKRKDTKPRPAELRCVGDEEVATFEARGVGALKVGWRKKSRDSTESGLIEGIEDEVEAVDDELGLIRRDKVSRTHTVPLRLSHDKPGVHTVTLTGVTDSLHNTYTPSGPSAEKNYNVITRPSARFDCSAPIQLLKDRTVSIAVQLDGSGPLASPLEITYIAKTASGETKKSIKMNKRTEILQVSEAGSYSLLDISGTCAGTILEPSTCYVQLVPPPTVDMTVTTLHEW